MAASSTLQMLPLLFLFSLFLGHCLAANGGSFSVDLIHHDSVESPLYNPLLSLPERVRAAAHRSHARASALSHHLHAASHGDTPSLDSGGGSFESDVIPHSFEYLMHIHVGTPSHKILAIVDTGSDLVWTNCKNKDDGTPHKFNPVNSTTYEFVSCQSDECHTLPHSACDFSLQCQYLYTYGDRSQTSGVLSSDTFTFGTSNGSIVHVPNITFGCSHLSTGSFHANGLVGLGGGSLSLVRQLSKTIKGKFSYCLVPYTSNASRSLLKFGANDFVTGPNVVTTPLSSNRIDTFYTLTLNSIKVGNGAPLTTQRINIIVDSGTTLTYLDPSILQPLVDSLAHAINLPQVQDPDNIFNLCFNASQAPKNFKLPKITFALKSASLTLSPSNSFVSPAKDMLCLAMASAGQGWAILGNIAQQNFHIGYDLEARTVSFAPTDCTKL